MQSNRFHTFICCLTNKSGTSDYKSLISEIQKELGEICHVLPSCSWIAPVEYRCEMGENLECELWFLENQSLPDIIKIKRWLMFFEHQYSIDNCRQFNLNPGFLSKEGMFLLTHKDNKERKRELLDSGIWQEQQYEVIQDSYIVTMNTFSEYQVKNRIRYFEKLIFGAKTEGANNKVLDGANMNTKIIS